MTAAPTTAAPRTTTSFDVFAVALSGVNLIEASAGTGKTWTLCGLYLRLLLEREFTVQQILVVTFTTTATAELRERIRARILDLLGFLGGQFPAGGDPFITRLADDLLQQSGNTRQALTARLELALHSFDEAAIFTIHGFCQRALADNPFAAGLPMNTELIESDHDLLMEAVHDFWRRHVAHESAAPELVRYLRTQKDSPEKYAALLTRRLAKPLARHIWPAGVAAPPLAASVLHQPYREARAHWLVNRADICSRLTAALDQLHGGTYKPASLLEAAAHWDLLCRDDDPLAECGKKTKLFRQSVLASKTNKKRVTPTHAFFDLAERYLAQREALEHSLLLARCRLLKRLFEEGTAQIQSLKRSRQVVAFDDMLANVHERLRDPDHPWLAASIRARFPAALIDEFQDTDPLQFAIFRTIYDTEDSTVFLVGDPKQAIYSFRHADLHSYLRATRWAVRHWSLTDNRRSCQPLLTGLNRLFGRNANAFVLPEIRYRPVGFGAKARPSFVDGSTARAPLQVWRLPDAGAVLQKRSAERAAVDATAAEIARLLAAALDGRITLAGRPLQPGDIAVLVRSRALGAKVKQALAALHVGAVELSRDSIFGSSEAEEWKTVLIAIASPGRDGLLRTALATPLFGRDAADIERIAQSESLLSGWLTRFLEYRALWVNRGFGVMYRQLFAEQAVARRLLGRPDGERRLTNFLHVGELLQVAAEPHPAPEALLRYLQSAQTDDSPVDAAQLHLESDQNLVQIVTIHSCKGLEYPIVFCPFLCDGRTKFGPPGPEGREYHDATLEPVIDFDDYDDNDEALLKIKAAIKLEQAAETVRILYVALTRAVHRCYLVEGHYQTTNPRDEGARSMLNWLVAGDGKTPQEWFDAPALTPRQLDAAWIAMAADSGGAVVLDPLPTMPGVPLTRTIIDAASFSTPAPPGNIDPGWRLSSYTGLTYGARGEQAAGDHDARTRVIPAWPTRPTDLPADDILRFPRGADAGECIHAVFENIDFTDRSGWTDAITRALLTHPPGRFDDSPPPATIVAGMLLRLVADVTTVSLQAGLQLAAVPLNRRLTELEFSMPVPHLSAGLLNSALKQMGYEVPALTFGALEGYLKGFIDLVFEYQGRYFILDWKSNHLGYTAADYGAAPIARAMADHGYHLQYLIYTLALHRYLASRIPDYRYETHFGGVMYLFVRGVRPGWPGSGNEIPGVYSHCPSAQTIRMLGQLLDESAPRR